MNFLTPLYLAGLAAVAIPVMLHLIRRQTRDNQVFSSLMFLSPSPPRVNRRSVLFELREAHLGPRIRRRRRSGEGQLILEELGHHPESRECGAEVVDGHPQWGLRSMVRRGWQRPCAGDTRFSWTDTSLDHGPMVLERA